MRVRVSSVLHAPVDEVWEILQRSDTLVDVAAGVMRYEGEPDMPEVWSVGTRVNLLPVLFDRIDMGDHFVEFVTVDAERFVMATRESGGPITRWDHTMRLQRIDAVTCRYTDEIDIQAGWRTPLVWAFAQYFYRHRHRRWHELLEQQFLLSV